MRRVATSECERGRAKRHASTRPKVGASADLWMAYIPHQGMTLTRSSEEVRRALEIQRQALDSSCVAYDNGNRWEASRIA
jgi:hypothetical protein